MYELTSEWQQLFEMMDDPDIDEQVFWDTMEGIEGEIEIKADGYAKVIADMNGKAEGLKAEIERLTARKKAIENHVKRMKENLQKAMEFTGKTKFKTDLFSFNIQNNPASLVLEFDEKDQEMVQRLPEKYRLVEYKVNKAAIKEDIKAGADVGVLAYMEQGRSLRIK
jgi:hypothetical protein